MFGSKSTFIPMQGVDRADDSVVVPFEKSRVKDAPGIEPERQLTPAEEAELYRYYGFDYSESKSDTGLPEGSPGTAGHDTSGPTTDSAMTRSEEQLSKEQVDIDGDQQA